MRPGILIAAVLGIAIISIGALVVATLGGRIGTQSPTTERSSSGSQLFPSQTSSQGHSTVNTTVNTSTVCQTSVLYGLGFSKNPGYVSTEVTCAITTTESVGNMTLHLRNDTSYSLPANFFVNSSTPSPLLDSYHYTLLYLNYNDSNPTHPSAVFNVTGTQIVHGNWTDGYHITYTNNELVNVSATLTSSSNYVITHVAQYPLPDRNYAVAYTSQEQEAILAALSNSTVRSDLAGIQYYVSFVSPAFNGIIEVDFYQINVQNGVVVDLTAAGLKVVQIYS